LNFIFQKNTYIRALKLNININYYYYLLAKIFSLFSD
jgi:hypothetical protein